ncbi:MerR family transcriptional regulator [Geothrix terrae]|uniref:MerR family transcriptional regulator n=1 Tax=Geothrix terrae TaxID=2922720 RepID=UPI001FAC8CED|nr:helix-turn-helix transcriptional regulator [Geothrix terrae]
MAKDPRLGAYMIGVVSMRYGVHPQTLRLYEREGLLTPSRTEGKTRLYSDEDLERLEFILNLTRDLGVNLAGVEVVLTLRDRLNRMQEDLERLAQALEAAGVKDVPWPASGTGLVKLTPHGLRKR